ncbi:MBL fold metallo-hydrolase [Microbacterium kyungheense]|uniref:Glyoxylase-like metal-dependent hydrolase (Beta-lactamase superfamily II) n=1 Tax=Microbacterium kyungheense TaxID=1263636 RepID=A0A543EUC2_9MICO|nr:MBL fold metallo-hydrolase [Microbacterium kyungheense]TQM25160.1 glyoxylase-like metal-dependent hydrolase (beta-lactamase superfamily II) [Microbacterium kyungheense]
MRELIEVADGVWVATSAIMSTTSTLLVGGDEALLIDPSWLPSELEGLADNLDALRLTVVGGIATHAHHDHLLWHERFGAAPRWASATTARLARDERDTLLQQLGEGFPRPLADLMGRVEGVDAVIPPGSVPSGFAPELVVHDGHAPGHTAVWLPAQRVLVAGDMLSDHELPLPFWPDDVESYVAALDRLAPYIAQAAVVIPGHGTPGRDGLARLDADRRYLDDVVAGKVPTDPRMTNPGMDEEYEHLRRLVQGA